MKETLKVSIIIPVHNAENTLIRCVDSILSQEYKNIECILVENGSNDNSRLLCQKLASDNKNIIYRSIKENGASRARNVGLSIMTGDIVGFSDADDFLEKNAIATVVSEFIKDSKVAAVFGGFNIGRLEKNQSISKQYRGLKEQKISVTKALQLTLVNDSVMGCVWNKYYRTTFLKKFEFDKELSFCEDMHFNSIVLDSIKSKNYVKIISSPLYCYMQNVDSFTHDNKNFFDKNDNLKCVVALKKINDNCTLDSKTESYLRMKIASLTVDYYKYGKNDRNKRKKLHSDLKNNFTSLLKNLFVSNWSLNVKRVCKAIMYLILG